MLPDLAKFHHFGNISKKFWQFYEGLFNIWQNYEPTKVKKYTFGHIFVVVNGEILKNNRTIWSL